MRQAETPKLINARPIMTPVRVWEAKKINALPVPGIYKIKYLIKYLKKYGFRTCMSRI